MMAAKVHSRTTTSSITGWLELKSEEETRHCATTGINKNAYEGIWVHKGGGGTFENNDLRDNTKGPWDISDDSAKNIKQSGNIEK